MKLTSKLAQFRLVTGLVVAIMLAACGGGSGKSPVTGLATGKVIFSNVSGITFKTPTQEGLTGADGAFSYIPGEMVTFAIGDINDGIILGTAPGAVNITAVQLTGSSDPADPHAANLLQFISSLDDDREHLNGVTIPQAVRSRADTLPTSLNFFEDNPATFQQQLDAAVNHLFAIPRTPSRRDIALKNFCFDTYLPGGGSKVFGFNFTGCPESPPEELMQNGDFEGGFTFIPNVGQIPNGWGGGFNFPFVVANPDPVIGGTVLKLFGPSFNLPNAVGINQDFTPVPLQEYTVSAWVLNSSADALDPSNFAAMQLVFSPDYNFEDNTGEFTREVTISSDVTSTRLFLGEDVWTRVSVTATAPLDAVTARLQLLHVQLPPNTGGSIFFDDVSVTGPTYEIEPPIEYDQVWEDEFDGPSLDTSKWTPEIGYGQFGWGNDEWQYYTDDPRNLSITPDGSGAPGGHLQIKAYCDYLDSSGVGGVPVNALLNAGFELPDASGGDEPGSGACNGLSMPDWTTSNCNFVSSNKFKPGGFLPENPLSVVSNRFQNLKQYDNSTASQDVSAAPGQIVAASAYAMSWEGFPGFTPQEPFENLARLQILFLDAGGSVLHTVERVADSLGNEDYRLIPKPGDNPSDWTLMSVAATAPANTASARIQLQHELVTGGSATAPVWWDEASLTVSDPVCNIGNRNGSVTSAKINSRFSMPEASMIKYGKIEASIKVPVGRGAWPAFWMLGSNFPIVGWPESGEIDIMEVWTILGSNNRTTHSTLHWCPETDEEELLLAPGVCARKFEGGGLDTGASLGDAFHLYSVEWNPKRLIFKIDNNVVYRRWISPATMEEFNQPFYMILNLAMGGTLGSDGQNPTPNGSNWELPQTMLVDYVRVYKATP